MILADPLANPLAPPGLAPVMAPGAPLPSLQRELSRLGVHSISLIADPDKPGARFRGYVDTGRGHLRLFRSMNWTGIPDAPFKSKTLTKKLLAEAGFPTPAGKLFRAGRFEAALKWYRKSGLRKVVVKPDEERKGRGVASSISSAEELVFYFDRLPKGAFLIEEHVEGDDYRLLAVGGRFVAATRRVPAHVTGDGKTSVAKLVKFKNTLRMVNPIAGKSPLALDDVALHLLTKAGLTPKSVPKAGQVVWLRTASNVGSGGEHEEVTAQVHPCYIDLLERVAQTLGSPYSVIGMDILCHDITSQAALAKTCITEIEDGPGLFGHACPIFGEGPPRNVIRRVAEHVLRRYAIFPDFRHRRYLIQGARLDGYGDWLRAQVDQAELRGDIRQIDAQSVECELTGGQSVLDALMRAALLPPQDILPRSKIRNIDCVSDAPAPPGSYPTLPERN